MHYFTICDAKDKALFAPLSIYILIKLLCTEPEILARQHWAAEHYIKLSGRLSERLSGVILAHYYSRWREIPLT